MCAGRFPPVAHIALGALERWVSKRREEMSEVLPRVLPMLDSYLAADPSSLATGEAQRNATAVQVRRLPYRQNESYMAYAGTLLTTAVRWCVE